MSTILSRNLLALSSVYRIKGGQLPPTEVDLATPIQLVHDVHREAEIGGGPGAYFGFWNVSFSNVHAVVGATVWTQQTLDTPYNTLGALDSQQYWTWVMEVSVLVAPLLTMTEAVFNIVQNVITGALTSHRRPIAYYTAQSTITSDSGGTDRLGIRTAAAPYLVGFPVLWPRTATMQFGSTASGAIANVTGQALLYTCPVGVLPPGLA